MAEGFVCGVGRWNNLQNYTKLKIKQLSKWKKTSKTSGLPATKVTKAQI